MIKISTTYINSFALACTIFAVSSPTAWAMKNPIVVDRNSKTIISLPEGEEVLSKSDIHTCFKALDDLIFSFRNHPSTYHYNCFSGARTKGPKIIKSGNDSSFMIPNRTGIPFEFSITFYRNEASWFTSTISITKYYICCAHLSSDAKYLVTGGYNGEINIYELTYGWFGKVTSIRLIKTLERHTSRVTAVYLTNDGKYIVSGSFDKTIKVWAFDTGHCRVTLSGFITEHDYVFVCMTPNKNYVIAEQNETPALIWKISSNPSVSPRQPYSDCTIVCQSSQENEDFYD